MSCDAALLTALLFCSCCICADAENHRAEKQKNKKNAQKYMNKKTFEAVQPQELVHCV